MSDIKDKDENVLQLVKEFDLEYHTNMIKKFDMKKANIISKLFIDFVEMNYSPSKKYMSLLKNCNEYRDKFESNLTEVQKDMLENYSNKVSDCTSEIIEQAFVYGFCLANQFRDESKTIMNFES